MRIDPEGFRALDLEVHALLADVPLRDVSSIDLPGGGTGRVVSDVRALLTPESATGAGGAVRALFALRRALGRAFGWDRESATRLDDSTLARLTDEQRARSAVEPGTQDGPFRLVYVFRRELLGEIRNATVHAFSCMALVPAGSGYRFYWAIYVRPVSRWTGAYMALIEPFRRFIVYPAVLRRLRSGWETAYAGIGPAAAREAD